MKKVNLIVLLSCFVSLSAQQTKINKESNNLTLDGNIEYVEDNLIEAEALYRKSISKDSMNLAAKYNLGNSLIQIHSGLVSDWTALTQIN